MKPETTFVHRMLVITLTLFVWSIHLTTLSCFLIIEIMSIMDSTEHYVSLEDPINVLLFCPYFSYLRVWYKIFYFLFSVDALFAVYEASTLELWSFMMLSAIQGHTLIAPFVFYFFLVLFVVVILQVIIIIYECINLVTDYRVAFRSQ